MKTNFAKKTIKILTGVILGAFIFLVFYSLNPHETFSAQGATRKEVTIESTSYTDNEGIKQNRTDTTTTHYFISNGAKDYSTTNRTRTYTDNEGTVHTFTNYQDRYGGWSDEEEIIKEIIKDEEEIIKNDNTSGGKYIYTLLQPLPKEGTDLSENVTLEEYLTWAFRFVLALAGFLAVMMIVIGGVEYIISGASEAMRGEAKKRIENAIWGLVMALVSYLVLYTINPSLVDFEDNCFFKDCDKETTTNVGDNLRGEGITEIEDVPFDFGDQ